MLAGILHQAGYFLGDRLHEPRASNPRGFFEWYKINRINEEILSPYGKENLILRLKKRWLNKVNTTHHPGKDQRWLLALPLGVDVVSADPDVEKEIVRVVRREPFCYKDPRFSYTLAVWRRHLPAGTVSICVFREPDVTVESIIKECRDREYLADLSIDRRSAYRVWVDIYSHILFKHATPDEDFMFVHYNQIFEGTAIPLLSQALGVQLEGNFIDRALKRTAPAGGVPGRVREIYGMLCRRAGYSD